MNKKTDPESSPAERLEGMTLQDGWTIHGRIERAAGQTGAHFSTGYIAKHEDGRIAFVKALDFSKAFQDDDPSRALESLTSAFNFERDVLDVCNGQKMRNIVKAIGSGIVKVDDSALGKVQYLLFEPAESDLRKAISAFNELSLVWCLKVLHHAALGLEQLHSNQIAHQDVKPSNVLLFEKALSLAKLSDLGCASRKGTDSPRDKMKIPGAWSYAPPELLYGQVSEDWNVRRQATDMFQLGNLASFLLTGTTISQLINFHTPEDFKPLHWKGTYSEILTVIRDSFGKAMNDLRVCLDGEIQVEIVKIIQELCDPDPTQRGHRRTIFDSEIQYSMRPYVSRFANLIARIELSQKKIKHK